MVFPANEAGTNSVCVYWNEDTQAWETDGITTTVDAEGVVRCNSSHLTGVLPATANYVRTIKIGLLV
jgi:hypothetical protein